MQTTLDGGIITLMTTLAPPPISPRPERLFTVDEYLRMVETGILTKRDRVELIEGRIVEKMPTDPPHVLALELLSELLRNASPPAWIVRLEAPLHLKNSLPQPDIMVIRGPREQYAQRHPVAQDVLLVVEISDSTLREDRTEMACLYAAARVPFYWILNLKNRRLEVHSDPSGPDSAPTYRRKLDIPEDGTVRLAYPEGTKDFPASAMFPQQANGA
jgi:Uma2 family endonuclease